MHSIRKPQCISRMTGATLLEVLVAVVLVSITLLTGVRATNNAIGTLTDTLYYQRATRIAADINELYALMPDADRNSLPQAYTGSCTADCTPVEWLSAEASNLGNLAASSLPGGSLELGHATTDLQTTVTARLRWQTSNGEMIELTWQPRP